MWLVLPIAANIPKASPGERRIGKKDDVLAFFGHAVLNKSSKSRSRPVTRPATNDILGRTRSKDAAESANKSDGVVTSEMHGLQVAAVYPNNSHVPMSQPAEATRAFARRPHPLKFEPRHNYTTN